MAGGGDRIGLLFVGLNAFRSGGRWLPGELEFAAKQLAAEADLYRRKRGMVSAMAPATKADWDTGAREHWGGLSLVAATGWRRESPLGASTEPRTDDVR